MGCGAHEGGLGYGNVVSQPVRVRAGRPHPHRQKVVANRKAALLVDRARSVRASVDCHEHLRRCRRRLAFGIALHHELKAVRYPLQQHLLVKLVSHPVTDVAGAVRAVRAKPFRVRRPNAPSK